MVEVSPFAELPASPVEQLHAIVLAISHQHAVTAVDGNGVRSGEGTGAAALAAPAPDQRAVRSKAMNAGVAVAVGNVDLAVGRLGGGGRMVERRIERGP